MRVLSWLVSGRTANRFEAARLPEIADSCLNSTIAELEGDGIRIDRDDEVVQGRYGAAHVKRYRFDGSPENLARAIALLDGSIAPTSRVQSQEDEAAGAIAATPCELKP